MSWIARARVPETDCETFALRSCLRPDHRQRDIIGAQVSASEAFPLLGRSDRRLRRVKPPVSPSRVRARRLGKRTVFVRELVGLALRTLEP